VLIRDVEYCPPRRPGGPLRQPFGVEADLLGDLDAFHGVVRRLLVGYLVELRGHPLDGCAHARERRRFGNP
jgi:hypothetical protein